MNKIRTALALVSFAFLVAAVINLIQKGSYTFIELPVIAVLGVITFVLVFTGQSKTAIDDSRFVKVISRIITGFLILVLGYVIVAALMRGF